MVQIDTVHTVGYYWRAPKSFIVKEFTLGGDYLIPQGGPLDKHNWEITPVVKILYFSHNQQDTRCCERPRRSVS